MTTDEGEANGQRSEHNGSGAANGKSTKTWWQRFRGLFGGGNGKAHENGNGQ